MRRTESVLLVLPTRTETETAIILPDPTEDTVAETLVEIDCDLVCTADVEIDEEAAVDVVGRGLEEVHEDAGKREASVFGRDRQGCYVTVKIMRRAFGLAQDCSSENETLVGDDKKRRTISHQPPARVFGGAAHVRPAREVIEIKAEAILRTWRKNKNDDEQSRADSARKWEWKWELGVGVCGTQQARTVSVQMSRFLDGTREGDEHRMSPVRTADRGEDAHVVESKEVVGAERANNAH
jgi:hypothetical protein